MYGWNARKMASASGGMCLHLPLITFSRSAAEAEKGKCVFLGIDDSSPYRASSPCVVQGGAEVIRGISGNLGQYFGNRQDPLEL